MNCDLHTHTFHSDGSCSPRELVLLAKEKNLIIALTDHNPQFVREVTKEDIPTSLDTSTRLGRLLLQDLFKPHDDGSEVSVVGKHLGKPVIATG